jgi:FMN phosphatase YigB (HAD superfamily)
MVKTIRVQPFETLYVGNNIEYDILGAKKAGLRAALRGRQNSAADLSFSNWEELTQWVLAHSY